MPSNQTMGLKGTLSSLGTITGKLSNAALRGMSIELRNNEKVIQWKYEDEDDTAWRDLIDLSTLDYEAMSNLPTINGTPILGEIGNLVMTAADEITEGELLEILNE